MHYGAHCHDYIIFFSLIQPICALHNCMLRMLHNFRANVCKCNQQEGLWFQNSFKHEVPSVLKKLSIPQGRYFLVEMAANHHL